MIITFYTKTKLELCSINYVKISNSIFVEKRTFFIAKRIVEILFFLHHLLSYMEHYDVEFNHHYYFDQYIEVVS